MKKFYLLLPIVGLGVLSMSGVSSCSKMQEEPVASQELQVKVTKVAENNELIALEKKLDAYNSIYRVQPQGQNARSFWSFLKKVVRVVATDALGAIAGNLAGGPAGGLALGVSSSIGVAVGTSGEGPDITFTTSSSESAYCPSESSSAVLPIESSTSENEDNLAVGELHNKIIQDLYRRYPNIEKMSQEEIYKLVLEEVKSQEKVSTSGWGVTPPIENVSANAHKAGEIVKACSSEAFQAGINPAPALVETIQQTVGLSATEARILAGYTTTVAGIASPATVKAYTEGFNEAVASSSVSASFKESAQVFTAVAANSKVLWIPQK